MDAFYRQQEAIFSQAAESGLPPFPQDISESTSGNATPYVVSLAVFLRTYYADPVRARLLNSLRGLLARVEALSVEPICLLVGGSFLAGAARPKDIDCICFYTAERACSDFARLLAELAPGAIRGGVDVRFVPLDSDPILALKACAFFSVLYSRTRASADVSRGTVLVRLAGYSEEHAA